VAASIGCTYEGIALVEDIVPLFRLEHIPKTRVSVSADDFDSART